MIKTYKITRPCHNYSTVIKGKGGNAQRFDFTGGNEMTGTPATITLRTQYSQQLLEGSDMFKSGLVKLTSKGEGGEVVAAPKEPEKKVIEEITSPEGLIEFVGTVLEKPYQRPDSALAYAKKQGYEFPNLKQNKDKED